jgi:AraC family transcriptional regulator
MSKPETEIGYRRRIARVHDHIAEHLDQKLDLDRLAEVAALSRWHFHRIYHMSTGETVADTVRRLRLHRAAGELVRGDTPLPRVARRAGYGSVSAFVRAFAADYGLPPGAYRLRGRLEPPYSHPADKETTMYDVTIAPFDGVRLAAIAHRGDYQEIGAAFEKVIGWAASQGLAPASLRSFGIYYDDPDSVPKAQLRSDATVLIPPDLKPAGEVRAVDIPALRCASVIHKGPYAELERPYRFLYREWLPNSGQLPADHPPFEEYLNNPHGLPPTEWLTRICLPLAC